MTKSQSARARALRAFVVEWLGGECRLCGARERLELDHPDGIEWRRHQVDALGRAWIYAWEADHGLVRVLCRSCNAKHGRPEVAPVAPEPDLWTASSNEPF